MTSSKVAIHHVHVLSLNLELLKITQSGVKKYEAPLQINNDRYLNLFFTLILINRIKKFSLDGICDTSEQT